MGFHVTLREDDRRLIRALRSSPSEVFGRPYAGYLLFLVGGADTTALEWLKKHLVPLDSLTGDHVAYAIFAARVPIQLHVPNRSRAERGAHALGDVSLANVQRIESYIKSGNLGLVADGDHLNAVTYATDQLARAFGVLRHLPCVVVLDAFSSDEVDVIELDETALSILLPVLRGAIHDLTHDLNFVSFVTNLESLGSSQRRIEELEHSIAQQKYRLSRLPVGRDAELGATLHERIRNALRRGSHREFRRTIAELEVHVGHQVDDTLSQEIGSAITGYARTIHSLAELGKVSWPLAPSDALRYENIVDRYVYSLVPDTTRDADPSREELDRSANRVTVADH